MARQVIVRGLRSHPTVELLDFVRKEFGLYPGSDSSNGPPKPADPALFATVLTSKLFIALAEYLREAGIDCNSDKIRNFAVHLGDEGKEALEYLKRTYGC